MNPETESTASNDGELLAHYLKENVRLTRENQELDARLTFLRKRNAEYQRRHRQRKATKTK